MLSSAYFLKECVYTYLDTQYSQYPPRPVAGKVLERRTSHSILRRLSSLQTSVPALTAFLLTIA